MLESETCFVTNSMQTCRRVRSIRVHHAKRIATTTIFARGDSRGDFVRHLNRL